MHFCPPRMRSPHSNLSQPPLEVWCAERVHTNFSSVWQLGDASVFPTLQSVLSPPADRVFVDTVGSLLQRSDPVPATCQSSTSLSINPNKGSPSWWRVPLLPGLLDTPSQVCLPLHDTLLPLSALSVSETCMDFAPGLVKVTLRPRPGYVPKVLSTSFRSQVVTLHSFHPPHFASSEDERLHMLCPVRALKLYVDHSKVWRKTSQLLVCFGIGRHGLDTSKQTISHWVRDAISLAYEARNLIIGNETLRLLPSSSRCRQSSFRAEKSEEWMVRSPV